MYRKVIFLLFIIGVIFVVIAVSKNSCNCNDKIIYRYIPRTFEEEQNEPVYVTDIFKTLFSQPGVWEAGFGNDSSMSKNKHAR